MCIACPPASVRPFERALTRSVFRRAAYPTWIITGSTDEGPVGFTATSVVSVSMEPPLVSFNLSRTSSSIGAIRRGDRVAAHLLDASQTALAGRFSRDPAARFPDDGSWRPDSNGLPALTDTCARLVLVVRELVEAGDSYVVLAEVEKGSVNTAIPLLHHRGAFTPGDRLLPSAS